MNPTSHQLPSRFKRLPKRFRMFQDVSLCFDAPKEQFTRIFRIECVEEIFHREDRTLKNLLPFFGSHRDEKALSLLSLFSEKVIF